MFQATSRALTSVAVLGAAGGIGQPLSLLLKTAPYVTELRLYDIKGVPGVAADLSHIPSAARVTGFSQEELAKAVEGVEVVVIPAGVPRKPGMTRDDLFNTNAGVIKALVAAVARHSPKAHIAVITNPVNSTIPIAAEVLKKAKVYDPKRLYGVTSLDLLRARTFVSEALETTPAAISDSISVVGGHSGHTIIPLLSAFPKLSQEKIEALTHRIQFGGDEVVQAKAGAGSATLSMAQAGATFAHSLFRAINGEKGVVDHALVESPLYPDCTYFSSRLDLGKDGVSTIHPLPALSKYEEGLLEVCRKELKGNIEKGIKFAAQ
eukprot:gene6325-4553_t